MRILKVSEIGVDAALSQAADALAQGKLVVIPTDTVYGVAADARLPGAEKQLYEAKSRDCGKPIPLLAADVDAVEAYGAVLSVEERRLADCFWPGPLTLILAVPRRGSVQAEGFRVPDDDVTRALLREAGGVLRATSANQSGDPPALTAEDAAAALGSSVDIVLDGGPAPVGVPSTVARVEAGDVVVLREGFLSKLSLTEALRAVDATSPASAL